MRTYDEPWAPVPKRSEPPSRSGRVARAVLSVALVIMVAAGCFFVARIVAEATLGQCAPSWLTGADPQLCLNASVSRGTLTISGSTSLPDGAIIQIWADDNGTGFNEYWSTGSTDVIVSNGTFRRTFDVSSWGPGTIVVTAQFEVTGAQPQEVIDRYGWGGEGLRGPDVRQDWDRGRPPPMEVRSAVQVDLSAS